MEIYDTQTLGIVVFGGFMVISAVGIALVSTFSMKETSYEEALAKQRKELGKTYSARPEKKKKDKVSEKKIRGKKKEEKPNGKIPESENNQEEAGAVSEPAVAPVVAAVPVPEPTPALEVKPAVAPAVVDGPPKIAAIAEPSPATSPKGKKKKKVAKVEPASTQTVASIVATVSAPTKATSASATVPIKPAPAPTKPAPAPTKSAHVPAQTKSASAPTKSAPAPAPAPAPALAPASAPASSKSVPAPVKSAKSAPASSKSSAPSTKSVVAPVKSSPTSSKTVPVLEAVTKDVPVMAVPPVGSQQARTVAGKAQEPKKKASKKKPEPVAAVDSADAPLYLPYKVLVSTIRSMVFSEGEAHRIIELLSEKVGIIQETWHKATQKGDPVAILKKQLEEREKQLAAEQEDASAAKNRLRELAKELSAEKSKVTNVETRMSSQLSKREQEMIALQARMQASYQDHVAHTQALNKKVLSLQDQLEKGPNAQLARLQQENSILRDALNQATSQAESKQNAELAKLRQECTKLTKELGEKTESLLADERIRKVLETKLSTTEKQLSLLQASHSESEKVLQMRLEEVCEELRTTQSRNVNLQASLDKSQHDGNALSECRLCIGRLEAEISERSARVDTLTSQLEEMKDEKNQLVQQVATINSLLEASHTKKEEDGSQEHAAKSQQLELSLQEKDSQLSALQDDLKQLQMKQKDAEITIVELEQRNKSEDTSFIASLQDELKNLKEEVVRLNSALQSDNSSELRLLQNTLTEKDAVLTSLQEELREVRERKSIDENTVTELTAYQTETKETLQSLFPQISVETEQSNWLQVFMQKAQEALSQRSQESPSNTASPELLEKLKEAEESHGSLQAECEQYRTVLAETEGMLKHLQNSVEEEELVWKAKMANSEEQLRVALERASKLEAEKQNVQQVREQMMLLEAQLEKQSDSHKALEEMEKLRVQLSECQSHLDLAQKEAQAHKEALTQVREQLAEITIRTRQEQNGPAQPSQVQNELSQMSEKLHGEMTQRQQLVEEFEQAQTTITELQAQLDLMTVSAESPQDDTEDVAQLKERLEKEKKLSKDLGQAATKLQQLLKATQEQLTKERDAVRTLQDHLEGQGECVELKEGTSV